MAESYLFNQSRILPCAVKLSGQYGFSDVYAGVPVIIDQSGVAKIIELDLIDQEKELFSQSIISVQKLMERVKELGL